MILRNVNLFYVVVTLSKTFISLLKNQTNVFLVVNVVMKVFFLDPNIYLGIIKVIGVLALDLFRLYPIATQVYQEVIL